LISKGLSLLGFPQHVSAEAYICNHKISKIE
jgi:hypothetical protein